jgi:energy-coupling factor transporter ATP-binding protein EcfA2
MRAPLRVSQSAGMSTIAPQARLRAEVDSLADIAGSVGFALATDKRDDRIGRRDHLLGILRRYLEPRLAEPGHPVVVAVFGPTGSGKSTLVNTLVGRTISETGVIRPTTRRAVVWVHQRDAEDIGALLAQTGPVDVVADDHPVLASLAIVDTPDIDSIAEEHRRQTESILETADVAIAVTTPQRYADAVPWDVLAGLTERALDLVVVMNRMSRRAGGAVIDLAGLLRDARVGGIVSADDIIVIQEQRVRADGRLHGYALRHLARRLEALAADHAGVTRRGIVSAADHAVEVGRELAAAVEAQAAEGSVLDGVIDDAEAEQRREIDRRLEQGELVRGEVVTRWQRMVGVSELAELVGRGVTKLRDVFLGRQALSGEQIARVEDEVRSELVELGMQRARVAAQAIEVSWALSVAGNDVLADVEVDWARIRDDLDDSMAAWQSEVVALVVETGTGRRRVARVVTVGINAAATLLLLGVFAATGGITGTEFGVAAGAAAAQQTVLEKLFGAAAARRLATTAQSLLADRLGSVVTAAAAPYRHALSAVLDDPDTAAQLRAGCDQLARALEDYADE